MRAGARSADHTIGGWLTARAALTPGRVAIDFDGRQVSYAGLAAAASRRAAAFSAAGLTAGDRVAVLARNCPEQVEVFFACAQRGLIMVPLNWRLTAAELAYQVRDADPALLLAEPELSDLAAMAGARADLPHPPMPLADAEVPLAPLASAGTPPRPFADAGTALPASANADAPPDAGPGRGEPAKTGPADDDPLLILYTSGTAGRPKGAVLTHANCFWTNLSLDRTAELGGDDVVLQVLPQCHVGGWNVQPLLAWWKGARVVLERSFDPARVLALIASKRVTTMMGVPTNYLMLAAHPEFTAADLSSLRQVIAGGAPMPLPLIETWLARGVTVLQGYGLTEAAPNVLCVPPEHARGKAGSAGRPYLHVQVGLRDLDGDVEVAGAGTGELVISGPNVFGGYWRDPAATAAARWRGWLATGDVAERDADGFYWIRGRLTEMYISGGENVYPAEVEAALSAHAAIAEAAVIGVPDERWGEAGLAFVVVRPGHRLPEDGLAGYCRARLAAYKVPKHYRVVTQLPRLTSGKVDKLTLARDAAAGDGQGPAAG
jgi:fatty-acyl-CoA synthase